MALERERMVHMTQGFASPYDLDMLHTVAYVSFQELATRISHRNTGRYTQDPVCEQLLARIAQDENLHMVFYRNVLSAALEIAPDETMQAIWDVVSTFQMPGTPSTDSPAGRCRSRWPASTTCESTATRCWVRFCGPGSLGSRRLVGRG